MLQNLLLILAGIQKDCDSVKEMSDEKGRRGRILSRASQTSLAKGIH